MRRGGYFHFRYPPCVPQPREVLSWIGKDTGGNLMASDSLSLLPPFSLDHEDTSCPSLSLMLGFYPIPSCPTDQKTQHGSSEQTCEEQSPEKVVKEMEKSLGKAESSPTCLGLLSLALWVAKPPLLFTLFSFLKEKHHHHHR